MTNHFMQFIIGFSYSFPVITVNNKYQTLRDRKKISDKQNSNINKKYAQPKFKTVGIGMATSINYKCNSPFNG